MRGDAGQAGRGQPVQGGLAVGALGEQVAAYAGLVPRQYQSGESDRKGRITRRGPAVLRKLLVECA